MAGRRRAPASWRGTFRSWCAPGSSRSSPSAGPPPSTSAAHPPPPTTPRTRRSRMYCGRWNVYVRCAERERWLTHQGDEVIALRLRQEPLVQERPAAQTDARTLCMSTSLWCRRAAEEGGGRRRSPGAPRDVDGAGGVEASAAAAAAGGGRGGGRAGEQQNREEGALEQGSHAVTTDETGRLTSGLRRRDDDDDQAVGPFDGAHWLKGQFLISRGPTCMK